MGGRRIGMGVLFAAVAALAGGCGGGASSPTRASGSFGSPPASGLTPSPAAASPVATGTPSVTLALVNATLVDGTGAAAVRDAVIVISGDRIVAVGPRSKVGTVAAGRTIDLGGRTVLPGFINAHVHRGFDRSNLKAWAEGGVTTVRDESASTGQVAGVRAFQAELAADPHFARLVSFGTMLGAAGGYGDRSVGSADEARRVVAEQLDAGAGGAKISLEDGYAGASGLPKLAPEVQRAIVEAAHARGVRVSGHITQAAYLAPILESGVDDVAHIPYDAIAPAELRRLVERGVYVTPTFTVFRNYGAPVEGCVANVREIVKLGGKIALGNDYGGGPGEFELGIPMYEVREMAAAGMTPMQIVVASTSNASIVSGVEKELGTLEAGKLADLIVVGGDPLADVEALGRVQLVVHSGTVIRDEITR